MTFRNPIHRVNVVVVVVLLVFAAVPAHAFPLAEGSSAGWSLGSLWEAFRSLVAGIWQEEGMLIDPNGIPTGGDPDGTTVDEGIMIDPNG